MPTVAPYTLLASESTVQVLSPTLSIDVMYCTIRTDASRVIASLAVAQDSFATGVAATELGEYASGIETIMGLPHVVAGTGLQTLDPNGLLADNVVFTVQYVPPDPSIGTSITTEVIISQGAVFGVALFTLPGSESEAEQLITDAYNSLVAAAGG